MSNTAPAKFETTNGCGGSGTFGGLYAGDVLDVANTPARAAAEWRFPAPAGTTISAVSYDRWYFKEDDDDWQPGLRADSTMVDTCAIAYPAVRCASGSS